MANDQQAKQAKYRERIAERQRLVDAAIASSDDRDELYRLAGEGDKRYAESIVLALKGGVPAEDLKLVGLEIPDALPKRVASRQKKDLQVPEDRRPRTSPAAERAAEKAGEDSGE